MRSLEEKCVCEEATHKICTVRKKLFRLRKRMHTNGLQPFWILDCFSNRLDSELNLGIIFEYLN